MFYYYLVYDWCYVCFVRSRATSGLSNTRKLRPIFWWSRQHWDISFLPFLRTCLVIFIPPMLHTLTPLTCHRRTKTTVIDNLVKKTLVSSDTLDWNADRNTACSDFPEFFPSQQQMLGGCFICRPVLINSISL